MSRIEKPSEMQFNAREIECPICHAPEGQQCYKGSNHVERARTARWKKMQLRYDD